MNIFNLIFIWKWYILLLIILEICYINFYEKYIKIEFVFFKLCLYIYIIFYMRYFIKCVQIKVK